MTNESWVRSPYAVLMGVCVERVEAGVPVLRLDYADEKAGNPGMFHGGAIGGLLDLAALAGLETDRGRTLAPLSLTIQYLRAASARPTFASAEIVRVGRRLANVVVRAWQDDPEKPIAIGFATVQIL